MLSTICNWRSFRFPVLSLRRGDRHPASKLLNLYRILAWIASNTNSLSPSSREDKDHPRTTIWVRFAKWLAPNLKIGIIVAYTLNRTQLTTIRDQSAFNRAKMKLFLRLITIGMIKTHSLWSPRDGKALMLVHWANKVHWSWIVCSQIVMDMGLNAFRLLESREWILRYSS